jgi:predicted phage tail protein
MTRSLCAYAAGKPFVPILLLLLLLLLASTVAQEIPPKKFAVMATAAVQESPPQITLNWPADESATGYTIKRRIMTSDWGQVSTLPGGATSFVDADVAVGTRYEYQLIKSTAGGYTGYGYLHSAIRTSVADYFGKVMLIVENSIAGPLAAELARLEADLAADGWVVVRRDVSMNAQPADVKELIRREWDADWANLRAVYLFGHVPVPYSGDIAPDGHANHQGAWPADAYYGDMDGMWTDSSVTSTNAEREVNWNVPDDGKYDQSEIPSPLELMVGRVDLHNMTCYANKANSRNEVDLLRQYLNKNHAFRWGQLPVQRRALICDNFSDKGSDPIGGSAWRNFPAAVGNQIEEVPWDGYFPAATAGSYLWSYASGGGSYYYSMGVGTSDDFALKDVQVVFTMFMGSYFGDWNNESNFLRAALGSGSVLAASYSGFPHALYFPTGLGEPIGYGMVISQNNGPGGFYPPWNQGSRQVHVSLHGDPTLRLFPVQPIGSFSASSEPGTARLSWLPSPDSGLIGYDIFRGTSAQGPFQKITSAPINALSFTDTPTAGTYHYMVRAIKLEETGSGTFLNPSPGAIVEAVVSGTVVQTPNAPVLSVVGVTDTGVTLSWADLANETGYRLEARSDADWSEIASPGADVVTHEHSGLVPGTTWHYRLRAFNAGGISPYSAEVSATTSLPMPGIPSLQAGSATHSQVTLQWNDVLNETGYVLERRIGQGTWSQISTPSANTTSFTDQTVSPSAEYYYRIKAIGNDGESGYSPEVLVSTEAPPLQPPAAPLLEANPVSDTGIDLRWNDVSTGQGYRLEARTGDGAWTEFATPAASTMSFQHSGLAPSTRYEYRIRAFNQAGLSAYSDVVSVMTQAPPLQIPSAPVLTISGTTHSQISLSWTDVERESGYKIERTSAGAPDWTEIGSLAAGGTSFVDNGRSPSTTYTYRIRAFNEAGHSAYSSELSVTTQAPPLQPPVQPVLHGTVGSHTALNVTWGNIENATEFRLERRAAGSSSWSEIATIPAGTITHADTALAPSTTYVYRLRAVNSAGFSAYSDELSLTTDAEPLGPPAIPVLQAQVVSHSEVRLNWAAVENEMGFTIERRTGVAGGWVTIARSEVDATGFVDTQVLPSTTYAYRIEASNAAGSSGFSAEVSVATPAAPVLAPAAPVLLASAVSATEVRLEWNDVENETGYVLERRADGGSSWMELARLGANATGYSDSELRAETTYFYRIRAVNSGGASASAEATARTLVAPPEVQSSVKFVAFDSATAGLWPLDYGAGGTWIATQPPNFPTNISVAFDSATQVAWQVSADDPRALTATSGANIAAAWTAGQLRLNLYVPRGAPRRVALYFVDWSRMGSSQEISIRDVKSGTNLDTRSLDEFANGKYVVYEVEGNISISIGASEGGAVLSAILFGEGVPAPISDRPLIFTILGSEPDALRVRVAGDSGQRFKVQTTADFQTWTDVTQSILVATSMEMSLRRAAARSFFRTVNTR